MQLALTDDCVPLPPAGLALVLLKKDEGHEHNHASSLVMSASWTKEDLLPIEDEEGPTAAPAASAEEAPAAAPAARKRLRYLEAAGRLLFMSWNAGGGARNLPAILIEKGYHFFAIQEAHEDQMAQLHDTHNFVLEQDQCIAIRKPGEIQTIAHFRDKTIHWHVAEVFFERPRLGLNSLVIMSVHLSSVYAKRPVAGPQALELAVDAAMAACEHARRPSLDIVCGDINMARWQKRQHAVVERRNVRHL